MASWQARLAAFFVRHRIKPALGDMHDIARVRHADRQRDRRGAVTLDRGERRAREARDDLRDDRVAVLAARVVVGDDDAVGERLGDRAHLRALARIALAAATEHADEAAAAVRAQARQRLLERVGGVRVVDHDQGQSAAVRRHAAETIHASGDRLQPCERGGDRFRRFAQRMQHAGHREQIVDIEAAQQRRLQRETRVVHHEVEGDAGGVEHDVFGTHVGLGASGTDAYAADAGRQAGA